MSLYLTKYEVIDSLESAMNFFQKFSKDIYPSFIIESWYLETFLFHLPDLHAKEDANFIPVVTKEFRNALRQYSIDIEELIDPNKAEGNVILEKISGKQFLKKIDQKSYNKSISGPEPLLDRKLWMNYNNWVLARAFWEGVILSQEPGFKYIPPEETDGPLKLFIGKATKPLLGMNMMARKVGLGIIDESHNNFIVYPTRSFAEYFHPRIRKKKAGR